MSATPTIYALLVGIDTYPLQSGVRPLKGCVNDIEAIASFLRSRYSQNTALTNPMAPDGAGVPPARVDAVQAQVTLLKNDEATYQNIVAQFHEHLGQASHDDVVLFYYSGHGSQQPCAPELRYLEPDLQDETLVCFDSRLPGGNDLADKDLAALIAELAQKQPHIVVILDCCHSGSGTRDVVGAVRRAPTHPRQRPLDSYVIGQDVLLTTARAIADKPKQETTRSESPKSGWDMLATQGKHVLLAACQSQELAQEVVLAGQHRGIFSYYLLETLQRAGANLTYRELFKRVESIVRNKVHNQTPQIEWSDNDELDQVVLSGAIAAHMPYYVLRHNQDRGWCIDGGSITGIPEPVGDETAKLAILPFDKNTDQLKELSASLGTASVNQVFPDMSMVDITLKGTGELDIDEVYKAVTISLPLPPIGVLLLGAADGTDLVRQALASAGPIEPAEADVAPPTPKASLYVREADPKVSVVLHLTAIDGRYRISGSADARPLIDDIVGYSAENALKVVRRLEHIARWTTVARLDNKATRLAPDAVQMEIHRVTGPSLTRDPTGQPTEIVPSGSALHLEYEFNAGEWQRPAFKIKLHNTSAETLYCALVYLSEAYAIDPSTLLRGGKVRLEPGQEEWAFQKKPIPSKVPDNLWQMGVTERHDLIKLIVSTRDFDPSLLVQKELDSQPTGRSDGHRGLGSSLDRLMGRIQTRELDLDEDAALYADWTTTDLSITTVRPLAGVSVPSSGNAVNIGANVFLEPHSALEAQASLTSLAQAGRDVGNVLQPAILRDNSTVSWSLEFTTSRGSDPGLNVLELVDVKNYTSVTPQQPLVVRVNALGARTTLLDSDEYVLPYGFDGEFYLPLGYASQTEADGTLRIVLERLPEPQTDRRSIHGSIRILFQKVVNKLPLLSRLVEYKHPLLAAAHIDAQGEVTYEADLDEVARQVTSANKILLYIHGIIGDTQSMVGSARCPGLAGSDGPPPLFDRYDLILAFDYENLDTPIERTARDLGERLATVGLGPGHGKTLHIVAHSMGGLVSRWFIEREGGDQVVSHLVMLGTPNNGSPWSQIEDMATGLLSIGLNSLGTVVWPAKVLGGLVRLIDKTGVTLDQMLPDSDRADSFLQRLHSSADPHVPYTIIAGNTSKIAQLHSSESQDKLRRLWQKLFSQQTLHEIAGMAFDGHPNDIAATVQSIEHVPLDRTPQPRLAEIPCDHISYFYTDTGLRTLAKELANPPA